MITKFNQWNERKICDQVISESMGVVPSRVTTGDIIFTDRGGRVWSASSWKFFPRYLGSDPKKVVESPDYLRAVKSVNLVVGSVVETKSKGIVILTLKDSDNKPIIVGRYTPKGVEPTKIENSEFSKAGYERRTKVGGQLQTLTASQFLIGHGDVAQIRVSDNNVPHYVFKDLATLKSRILTNMKESRYSVLKEPIVLKTTKEFLDGGAHKFDWSKIGNLMAREDRLKFGIYLMSELCYPFWVWGGKSIDSFPGFSKVTFFAVPTDNSNAAYDSYLRGVMKTGGVGNLMVSSKTISGGGKGARSSILPKLNAMAKSMSNYDSLNNKFLAKLLPYFKESARGGSTIYPFMVNTVLGLGSKIKDPYDLWQRICTIHGKRSRKLTPAEMAQTQREVVAIQSKVRGGVELIGLGAKAPLNQNAAKHSTPQQWKDFSKYISDLFCDAIAVALNHDGASDLSPSVSWQLSLDNAAFVSDGTVHLSVREVSKDTKGIVVDNGKQSAGDPTRNITWLGSRPL